jgi:hypothetical protein
MAAVRPEMPAPMMTICARMGWVLEEKARVLHVVCEFNETAEADPPARHSLILRSASNVSEGPGP